MSDDAPRVQEYTMSVLLLESSTAHRLTQEQTGNCTDLQAAHATRQARRQAIAVRSRGHSLVCRRLANAIERHGWCY